MTKDCWTLKFSPVNDVIARADSIFTGDALLQTGNLIISFAI